MATSFSKKEVRHWIGSDHTDSDSLIELLTDLLNKDYSIEQMRKDIADSDLGDGELDSEAEKRMVDYWGAPCPDFEPDCICCKAWKLFDGINFVDEVDGINFSKEA